MHKCTHVACVVHAYMHTCIYMHAHMHICVYVPNGVFSLLMLFASTGTAVQYAVLDCLFTRHSTRSYGGSTHTIIHDKVSYSRVHSNPAAVHYIHYTVMCSEAPLSKRRQGGVWAMLACSEALLCALKHRCEGDWRLWVCCKDDALSSPSAAFGLRRNRLLAL